MVVRKIGQRLVQQLVKRSKPAIVRSVTAGYGELAGGIAGVGISIAIGDYYGAFTGITGNRGNGETPSRNPPFGYLEGEKLNGLTSSTFNKTLLPNQFGNRRRRNTFNRCCNVCSSYRRRRPRKRNSRR